eukprot:86929_1
MEHCHREFSNLAASMSMLGSDSVKTIHDPCNDHHFDIDIIPCIEAAKSTGNIMSFGSSFNDIAIHSQFFEKVTDSTMKFIASIVAHQCPRFDKVLYEIVREAHDYEEKINDCLFEQPINLIISAYEINNACDTTWPHPLEIHQKLKEYDASDDTQEIVGKVGKKKSPFKALFIHHFYHPFIKYVECISIACDALLQTEVIPSDVILCIAEYTGDGTEGIYYDCWYLKRNANKSQHKLVTLWNGLLFDEKCYELKRNECNGPVTHCWYPSTYLKNNENHILDEIVKQIRANNVLHIYRPIIWKIFMNIRDNPFYTYDIAHLDGITSTFDVDLIYDKESEEVSARFDMLHDTSVGTMMMSMLYIFGGNSFDALYAMSWCHYVDEYQFRGRTCCRLDEWFVNKMSARMELIYPLIIPNIYNKFKEFSDLDDELRMSEVAQFFNPAYYDPLIKCYLMEVVLFEGMDALVLCFAAFVQLNYNDMLMLMWLFKNEESESEALEMVQNLCKYKDVESMAKVYNEFRNKLVEEHSHVVPLQTNPLIVPLDYKPQLDYWTKDQN